MARKKKKEIGYMRQEYTKINDALSQRLLAEATPKKSSTDPAISAKHSKTVSPAVSDLVSAPPSIGVP